MPRKNVKIEIVRLKAIYQNWKLIMFRIFHWYYYTFLSGWNELLEKTLLNLKQIIRNLLFSEKDKKNKLLSNNENTMISIGLSDFESCVQRRFFDIFLNSKYFVCVWKLRTRLSNIYFLTHDFSYHLKVYLRIISLYFFQNEFRRTLEQKFIGK